jgi:hypothetical protein
MKGYRLAYAITFAAFAVAWMLVPVPGASQVSAALGMLSLYSLVIISLVWIMSHIRPRKRPSRRSALRFVAYIVGTLVYPAIIAALASNGEAFYSYHRGHPYTWQPWLANFLNAATALLLYVAVMEIPISLHRNAPRELVSARACELVPAWLSAVASTLTGLLILQLHFINGPLEKLTLAQTIIAGCATGVLLYSFYKWQCQKLWEFDISTILSPSRWRETVREVVNSIDDVAANEGIVKHSEKCEECKSHLDHCDVCRKFVDDRAFIGDWHMHAPEFHSAMRDFEAECSDGEADSSRDCGSDRAVSGPGNDSSETAKSTN